MGGGGEVPLGLGLLPAAGEVWAALSCPGQSSHFSLLPNIMERIWP